MTKDFPPEVNNIWGRTYIEGSNGKEKVNPLFSCVVISTGNLS